MQFKVKLINVRSVNISAVSFIHVDFHVNDINLKLPKNKTATQTKLPNLGHREEMSLLLINVEYLFTFYSYVVVSGRPDSLHEGGVSCPLMPRPPQPHPSWTVLSQMSR